MGRRQEVDQDWSPLDVAANAAGGTVGYDLSPFKDPHEFVFGHCRTIDPLDGSNPIKPFPDHRYLHELLDVFLQEDTIMVAKSRQMMATWLACAFADWTAMGHPGAMVFCVSRKEDDAGFGRDLAILWRCRFIYEHLPESMRIPMKLTLQPPVLSFPSQYSSIMGLSQDTDAFRSYTATLVLCDEWAFQERARLAYSAMKPVLRGSGGKKGKLIGLSSPNGENNLFAELVHDQSAEALMSGSETA